MRFESLAQQAGKRVASNGAARPGRATAARLACAWPGENNFSEGIWRRERAAWLKRDSIDRGFNLRDACEGLDLVLGIFKPGLHGIALT